jgi:hypothetical protein
MQSRILKMKILVCVLTLAILILNCTKKSNLENQISIKIISIDSETKKPRVNAFDKIELRTKGIGYLMKTFDKVGEYTIDSTGSVKVKVDRTEENHFILSGPNIYGAIEFAKEELKDGQEITIEVISLKNR